MCQAINVPFNNSLLHSDFIVMTLYFVIISYQLKARATAWGLGSCVPTVSVLINTFLGTLYMMMTRQTLQKAGFHQTIVITRLLSTINYKQYLLKVLSLGFVSFHCIQLLSTICACLHGIEAASNIYVLGTWQTALILFSHWVFFYIHIL